MNPLFVNSPTIVQGITGHHGSFHTLGMIEAGTHIVAGVTPGKGGQEVHGVPVYNSVHEAVEQHQATTSVVFVPPPFAKSALLEAIDAGITLIVCITEGIPVHDMLAVTQNAQEHGTVIIGPNCPGIIVPGSHKLGIIAAHITTPGRTAIISRSGTLTYELSDALTKKGIGQRIVLGIGGDPIQGLNFSEALKICEEDDEVNRIIMVGEIGGTSEQIAADYIKTSVTKPVYGLVVGHSLPAGQQFGHAGAIVGGLGESAKEKTKYMRERGITMRNTLDELIVAISKENG
jgi:succinyl-CoA synthetase alpha subunit